MLHGKARLIVYSKHDMNCSMRQVLHKDGWDRVKAFVGQSFPIVAGKSTHDLGTNIVPLHDAMESFYKEIGSGLRRKENEMTIFWASLPSVGVMSASFCMWLPQVLSGYLNQAKDRSVAIVLAPNRSGNIRAKEECGSEEEASDGDSDKDSADEDSASSLRTVYSKMLDSLDDPARHLECREFKVFFSDNSIYGKRKGYHDALVVTAKCNTNVFHDGKLWRRCKAAANVGERGEGIVHICGFPALPHLRPRCIARLRLHERFQQLRFPNLRSTRWRCCPGTNPECQCRG